MFKKEGQQGQNAVNAEQHPRAAKQQYGEQHGAQHPGAHPHARTFDVEDAAGHELARVHPVVIAEGETLQSGIVGEPQIVSDQVANRFTQVVLAHGEESTQHRDTQQQIGAMGEPGLNCGLGIGHHGEQSLGLVHRGADELGNDDLRGRGQRSGKHRKQHAPAIAHGHGRNAGQGPGIEANSRSMAVSSMRQQRYLRRRVAISAEPGAGLTVVDRGTRMHIRVSAGEPTGGGQAGRFALTARELSVRIRPAITAGRR